MSGFGSLDELARRPDAAVLIVHRRDAADPRHDLDCARTRYPAMVVLPLDGPTAAAKALRGRDVVLWPYGASRNAQRELAAFTADLSREAKRLRLIAPEDPRQWKGPADLNGADPVAWAREHCLDVPRLETPLELPDPVEEGASVRAEPPAYVQDWNPPTLIEEPWPKPIDVFTRSAVPALRRGLLPPSIEDFVLDQSEIVGSDPCILATSALTCLAVVTHDSLKLQPRRHDAQWKESARIWGAFVGDPSTKKTPALARALSHLRKLDIDLAAKGEAEMPKYEIALKRHAKEVQKAVDNPALDIPEAPPRPARERFIAEDTTIEKLADLLVDNPGGLLIHHDELSGFFGSFDAYSNAKGKDAAFWLQTYNGGPRRVDRVSRGSIIVPNLSVCIVGGIQPDKIRELAGRLADDGLVQRFMITLASEVEGIGVDRAPDRSALDGYRAIMDWLSYERGKPDEPIRLSDGAIDVMRDVEERLKAYRSMGGLATRLRSHVGKWDGLFCRLCLLYHACECAEAARHVYGEVSQDNAERVRFWMLTYLMPHLMAFYDDVLGNSGALAHVQWIAGHILAKGATEISARDIYQAYRPWRGMPVPVREQVMSTLEVVGWIRSTAVSKRQTSQRWIVNPAVPTDFASLRDEERERRDSAKNRVLRAFYES